MSGVPAHLDKIVWNDSLVIGVPVIDEQHALLCSLANRLLDHPEARAQHEFVVDIITELGKFLILHFKTEEMMMRQLGVPADEYEHHVRAHNQIIDEYADLNMAAAHVGHHTSLEIFNLVKQWVGDHFHCSDAKIRNYLPAPSAAG